MPFWVVALLILGATFALNAYMASRIKLEKRKAAGLGDFNFPTAQEDREQAVIVGTVRQKSPNCTWYGDLQTVPIKKKVPNPLFFGLVKKTVETGQYRYFVGMKLDLGSGAGGCRLREMQIDEKVVWQGALSAGTFSFDKSNLFGGEEKEGGYAGTVDYYGGTWTQTYNAYLESQLQPTGKKARNCKGNTYLIWRGPSSGKVTAQTPNGYVGISTSLKPFSFVLDRFPNLLSQPSFTVINGDDANPIEWAVEVLTNQDYGGGIPLSELDLPKFRAAAQTCFNEGLGCSVLWDTDRELEEVINDINELIDGAIFVDRTTGLWTVELARADYDIEDLFIFNSENILEEIDFSTNTGKDAPSKIIVPYVDKAQNHKTREADFKDLATRRNQAAPNAITKEIYGVANGTQAAQLCFREARVFASNLRKLTFKADRRAHWVRPFSVFRYQREDLETGEILDFVFRAARVDDGELLNGEIEIEAIQDVFSLGTLHYAPPAQTGWVPISGVPVAAPTAFVAEQPFFFSGANSRLWAFAKQPNGAQRNYDLFIKQNSAADYARETSNDDFAPTGTIVSNYARTAALDASNSLVVTMESGLARLVSATPAEIAGSGANLFLFADTGEICAFQTVTDNGNGTATLNNVWRGLYDTANESHNSGARVWFFSYGQSLGETNVSAVQYNAKFLPNALGGSLELAAATAVNFTPANRAFRPLPPVDVRIGGVENPTAIPAAGSNIEFTWKTRNRLTQTEILAQSSASVAAETGALVGIKIYNAAGTLLATREGLTGTAFSYTPAMQTADGATAQTALSFVVYSIKNNVSSFQAVRISAARPTGTPSSLPNYTPTGTPPAPTDSPTSIGGLPIIGAPSGTNQTLVTDGNGNLIWVAAAGLTEEQIQDMLATFLQAGANVSLTYNDVGNQLTVSATVPNETIDDRVAALISAGANISVVYNDAGNVLTISATGLATTEDIQDIIGGSFLAVGSGLTKFYDDAANTLNLDVAPERIEDIVGALLTAGSGVSIVYDDVSNVLTISSAGGAANPSRAVVSFTTASLANNATETGTVSLGKSFRLKKITVSDACRVRLYATAAARLADTNRAFGDRNVFPYGEQHGIIGDWQLDSLTGLAFIISPEALGGNADEPPVASIYYSIQNQSGAPALITTNFLVLDQEN